jgi:hypothetical protein
MKRYLSLLLILLWIAASSYAILYIETRDVAKIDSLQNELDSLKIIDNEKNTIRRTLQVAYPQLSIFEVLAYGEIFYYVCETKYGIHFMKPAAIIGVESNWDPSLMSYAKCRGLGQLGSAAAKEGCDKYGIPYKEGYTEWNDPLNIGLSLDYYCSRAKTKGDSFAVREYIGGITWPKAAPGGLREKQIKKYAQDVAAKELKIRNVLTETIKLDYIYKGAYTEVQNDKSK